MKWVLACNPMPVRASLRARHAARGRMQKYNRTLEEGALMHFAFPLSCVSRSHWQGLRAETHSMGRTA